MKGRAHQLVQPCVSPRSATASAFLLGPLLVVKSEIPAQISLFRNRYSFYYTYNIFQDSPSLVMENENQCPQYSASDLDLEEEIQVVCNQAIPIINLEEDLEDGNRCPQYSGSDLDLEEDEEVAIVEESSIDNTQEVVEPASDDDEDESEEFELVSETTSDGDSTDGPTLIDDKIKFLASTIPATRKRRRRSQVNEVVDSEVEVVDTDIEVIRDSYEPRQKKVRPALGALSHVQRRLIKMAYGLR